ncbi:MaoC family dehydratase N-terminal domain-containing protein [Nocardioides sp. CFH 31398]|uniref:FAS1-like dehydratase domain-containing protein n=1 Tax=Nocardioides sp. CFH 31398 TaxID=2919579 RepID=UPI001F056020|nr:MaoC family dehydratase N-terminal domain-containing protein [Nocardioides sp. CFH 31398]MCH1866350.1 MaoC family dehydratase N-terminal domain-containing protein [Nocardioides sp. CFH 31398]
MSSEVTEVLLPGVADAVAGLLDVPAPADGALPLMWHWFFCLDRPRTADLGRDGHPTSGGPVDPPGAGRRRMWAGGEVTSLGPLRVGEVATRRSTAREPQTKQGRSGRLEFVSVDHEVVQGGRVVVRERQDLVYRDAPAVDGSPPEPEPVDPAPLADGDRPLEITPPLLFRFSALTYNGHRIHYDRDHARHAEGYPGLVTHGPLQALAMAEAARAAGVATQPGTTCRYRLVSPLFDHQGLVARADRDGSTVTASVRDLGGRTTARATFDAA